MGLGTGVRREGGAPEEGATHAEAGSRRRAVSELGTHVGATVGEVSADLTSGYTQWQSEPRPGAQPDLSPLQPGIVLRALQGAQGPSRFH